MSDQEKTEKKPRTKKTPEQRAEDLRKRADAVMERAKVARAKRFVAHATRAGSELDDMARAAPDQATSDLCLRIAEELRGIFK